MTDIISCSIIYIVHICKTEDRVIYLSHLLHFIRYIKYLCFKAFAIILNNLLNINKAIKNHSFHFSFRIQEEDTHIVGLSIPKPIFSLFKNGSQCNKLHPARKHQFIELL